MKRKILTIMLIVPFMMAPIMAHAHDEGQGQGSDDLAQYWNLDETSGSNYAIDYLNTYLNGISNDFNQAFNKSTADALDENNQTYRRYGIASPY